MGSKRGEQFPRMLRSDAAISKAEAEAEVEEAMDGSMMWGVWCIIGEDEPDEEETIDLRNGCVDVAVVGGCCC